MTLEGHVAGQENENLVKPESNGATGSTSRANARETNHTSDSSSVNVVSYADLFTLLICLSFIS